MHSYTTLDYKKTKVKAFCEANRESTNKVSKAPSPSYWCKQVSAYSYVGNFTHRPYFLCQGHYDALDNINDYEVVRRLSEVRH